MQVLYQMRQEGSLENVAALEIPSVSFILIIAYAKPDSPTGLLLSLVQDSVPKVQ